MEINGGWGEGLTKARSTSSLYTDRSNSPSANGFSQIAVFLYHAPFYVNIYQIYMSTSEVLLWPKIMNWME